MFSTSKIGPRPKTRTFARAGTSCVCVTMTLTQPGRPWMMFKQFRDDVNHFCKKQTNVRSSNPRLWELGATALPLCRPLLSYKGSYTWYGFDTYICGRQLCFHRDRKCCIILYCNCLLHMHLSNAHRVNEPLCESSRRTSSLLHLLFFVKNINDSTLLNGKCAKNCLESF